MDEIQYLTFYIGDEIFALDVLKIKEIIPYDHITTIPLMQSYVEGVMNIRGSIVPIISLNDRLNLHLNMQSKKQSIIIISLNYDGEISDVGIIVSKVDQVFTLNPDEIESSPIFGAKIEKRFIKNIAKFKDDFISILDIDEILNLEELSTTKQDEI